jgi:fumarate hydratase class II
MPGKVNPVIPEAVIMACAQVIGYDAAITLGGLGSYFELNLMIPLIAYNTLAAIALLTNAVQALADRCITGLEADANRCRETVERNLTLATVLAPVLGYDKAAEIAKEAQSTGKTVREVAAAWGILPDATLTTLLDPYRMTEPDD